MLIMRGVLAVLVGVALETASCWLFLRDAIQDIVMVYLFGVVAAALRFGRVTSIATAVLSVAAIDFFFTTPTFSFAVDNPRLVLTFFVFLAIAYVIGDLTERVRRATANAQASALEARSERMRSALLSSVSHDLRTPLAVLHSTASMLLDREEELTAERRRIHLRTILDEAAHLSRLVQHLVDATNLESGGVRVRKEWLPLEEIVGVALHRLNDLLGSRLVHVRIDPDASLVPADAALLEQVFLNLLENAAKYTRSGTPLAISARRVENGVEVAIADSGDGVPLGFEDKIFEKFERMVRSVSGMGLGLTICRGIVDAHGGRIWCENTEGGGATFRFVLPRGDIPELIEP
jgi:two-component system sensor histidine kinase KdpD